MRVAALFLLMLASSADCHSRESSDASEVFTDSKAAALAEASAEGDTDRIRKLVRSGADPDARSNRGTTLLQWALLQENTLALEALLGAGADPSLADARGETVMHYAAKARDPRYLDILLRHHVDPDTPNTITRSVPLISALLGNREHQFHKLLAAGANVGLADRLGNTPLHLAAKINANRRVLDLLRAGADPLARNHQGATFQQYLNSTPVDILSADALRQRELVFAWLREHGIPVERSSGR